MKYVGFQSDMYFGESKKKNSSLGVDDKTIFIAVHTVVAMTLRARGRDLHPRQIVVYLSMEVKAIWPYSLSSQHMTNPSS